MYSIQHMYTLQSDHHKTSYFSSPYSSPPSPISPTPPTPLPSGNLLKSSECLLLNYDIVFMCICAQLHVHMFFYFRTGKELKDMQM